MILQSTHLPLKRIDMKSRKIKKLNGRERKNNKYLFEKTAQKKARAGALSRRACVQQPRMGRSSAAFLPLTP
jgi:hypothetical protein